MNRLDDRSLGFLRIEDAKTSVRVKIEGGEMVYIGNTGDLPC